MSETSQTPMSFDTGSILSELAEVLDAAVNAQLNAHGRRAGLDPLAWRLHGAAAGTAGRVVPQVVGQVIASGDTAADQATAEGWAAALGLTEVPADPGVREFSGHATGSGEQVRVWCVSDQHVFAQPIRAAGRSAAAEP